MYACNSSAICACVAKIDQVRPHYVQGPDPQVLFLMNVGHPSTKSGLTSRLRRYVRFRSMCRRLHRSPSIRSPA